MRRDTSGRVYLHDLIDELLQWGGDAVDECQALLPDGLMCKSVVRVPEVRPKVATEIGRIENPAAVIVLDWGGLGFRGDIN